MHARADGIQCTGITEKTLEFLINSVIYTVTAPYFSNMLSSIFSAATQQVLMDFLFLLMKNFYCGSPVNSQNDL